MLGNTCYITFASVRVHTRVSKKEYLHHGQMGFVRAKLRTYGVQALFETQIRLPQSP